MASRSEWECEWEWEWLYLCLWHAYALADWGLLNVGVDALTYVRPRTLHGIYIRTYK